MKPPEGLPNNRLLRTRAGAGFLLAPAPQSRKRSASTRPPVPRFATHMSEGDHLRVVGAFTVHDHIRESAKRNPACLVLGSDAGYECAYTRRILDQTNHTLCFSEKISAKPWSLLFVPGNRSPQLLFRVSLDANRLGHLRRSCVSMSRWTSSQLRVVAVPASKAWHRRSISAAHASRTASGLSSLSASRLAINRVAISALSSSGSFRASRSTVSAVVVMAPMVATKLPTAKQSRTKAWCRRAERAAHARR